MQKSKRRLKNANLAADLKALNLEKENENLRQSLAKKEQELKAIQEAAEKPHYILQYTGAPFGERKVRVEDGRGYFQINQTLMTLERLQWQVVALDSTNPKERKVTLQFVKCDGEADYGRTWP